MNIANALKRFVTTYFILIVIFLSALFLACLIPSSLLTKNVGQTLSTFQKEGTYPNVGFSWRPVILDNFTDPLMVNTAYSVDSRQPFRSALLNFRHQESLGQVNQIINLEKFYQGAPTIVTGYERYWHGYLVFLRPLLVFFPYSMIRNILTSILFITAICYLFLIYKKLGGRTALFTLLGLVMVDFFFIGRSLQFAGVFLVGMLAAIYFLLTYRKQKNYFLLFFLTGGLTCFFDLLTSPLVVLGLLLIVITKTEKKQRLILNCLFWAMGYLLLWLSKWLIAAWFFSPGAVIVSFNQVINRTVNQADANFSQFKAVQLNLLQLIGYSRYNRLSYLLANSLFFLLTFRYFTFSMENAKKTLSWLTIIFIPYLWYLIAANHSYLHCWYSYRDQLMSVVGILFVMTEFIDWQKIKKDLGGLRPKLTLKSHHN